MNYIMLFGMVFFVCIQEFIKKSYLNKNEESNDMLFNFFSVLGAIPLFLLANTGEFHMHLPTLLYSLAYASCYAVALIFTMKALNEGYMGLTVVVISFSFIISVIFGVLFLHEPIGVRAIIGIILLGVALIFMSKSDDKNEDIPTNKSISLKWIIYVFLAMLGNGICSVVVKLHTNHFPGQYSMELLIMAMAMVLIICFVLLSIKSEFKKEKMFYLFKPTLIYGGMVGIGNGVANYLTLRLMERMDLSKVVPISKSGVFILTYIVSVFYYKEKMTKKQTIGFVLSLFAIILLNL